MSICGAFTAITVFYGVFAVANRVLWCICSSNRVLWCLSMVVLTTTAVMFSTQNLLHKPGPALFRPVVFDLFKMFIADSHHLGDEKRKRALKLTRPNRRFLPKQVFPSTGKLVPLLFTPRPRMIASPFPKGKKIVSHRKPRYVVLCNFQNIFSPCNENRAARIANKSGWPLVNKSGWTIANKSGWPFHFPSIF